MGCGCGGARNVTGRGGSVLTHDVVYQSGDVRHYLTAAEAEAAVRASLRTDNPASYAPPQLVDA
jgi:hypothetical protein